jgi:hypothetical protein
VIELVTTHRMPLALCAAAVLALAGCSTQTSGSQDTVTVTATPSSSTAASSSTSTATAAPPSGLDDPLPSECSANAASAPVPTVEDYGSIPDDARITVTLTGLLSGSVTPGAAPTEVDVTLCNESPVDYPAVGVLLVLTNCTCADNPMGFPEGSIERFDAAANAWVALPHPVVGGGMDYLGTFTDVQAFPRGKSVTFKYRVALDASMTEGDGGLEAAAVMPSPIAKLGSDEMQFGVVPA